MNLLKQTVENIEGCYQSGKYPLENDNKVHVLYLGFYLNGTGIYRALLPALEMNKTTSHAAIVNHLEVFHQSKQAVGYSVNINDDLIQWADHIVFATAFHKLSETIAILRQVNKKSDLKFYLDIDDNYHVDMPGQDPIHVEKQREKLLDNMNACGNVICENKNLQNHYNELLNDKFAFRGQTRVLIMPNLLSDDCYTGLEITPRTSDKFRIGMVYNPTQWRDVYPLRNTLLELNKKYKDSVELIVFGWNTKISGSGADALKKVNYQWIQPVGVTDYFQKLANLHFDIALMPLQDNQFNNCKSYHKLLQYSQAGIVAVCSKVEPYTNVILPADTSNPDNINLGHLTVVDDNWMERIEHVKNLSPYHPYPALKLIGDYNKKTIAANHTWHTNREILTKLFY